MLHPFILQPIEEVDNMKDENTLRIAAEQGDVESQFELGRRYRYGKDGTAVDINKAFHYFSIAASNGHAIAQHRMAWFYIYNEEVNFSKL